VDRALPAVRLKHCLNSLLDSRQSGGNQASIQGPNNDRIARLLNHGREFPLLEQVEGPLQWIGDQGGIEEDPLVLIALPLMVVGIHPESRMTPGTTIQTTLLF
jgi:hypothetical protein